VEDPLLGPLKILIGTWHYLFDGSLLFKRITGPGAGEDRCLLQIKPNGDEPSIADDILGDVGGLFGNGNLVGGILGQNTLDEDWVLGGAFLAHIVAVFDFDHGTMGFAEYQPARKSSMGEVSILRSEGQSSPVWVGPARPHAWVFAWLGLPLFAGVCGAFACTRFRSAPAEPVPRTVSVDSYTPIFAVSGVGLLLDSEGGSVDVN